MGIYVNIIETIKERLTVAQAAGNLLESVKKIYIGSRALVEGIADTPSITIKFINAEETAESAQYRQVLSNIEVILQVHYGLKDEQNKNIYYDWDNSTGILYLIENILDVLNNDTQGNMNPAFDSKLKIHNSPEIGEIVKVGDNMLTCDIKLKLKSASFFINGRS